MFLAITAAQVLESVVRQLALTEVEEIMIVFVPAKDANSSYRKLTFDTVTKTFDVWIGGAQAWSGEDVEQAAYQFNTIDPVNVDYTRENMAACGF